MKRTTRLITLACFCLLIAGQVVTAHATSREVMIEDLTIGHIENDIHHRAERPGKIVRVVPWIQADGSYAVVAITEVGWVYQSTDSMNWTLVGQVFDSDPLKRGD